MVESTLANVSQVYLSERAILSRTWLRFMDLCSTWLAQLLYATGKEKVSPSPLYQNSMSLRELICLTQRINYRTARLVKLHFYDLALCGSVILSQSPPCNV